MKKLIMGLTLIGLLVVAVSCAPAAPESEGEEAGLTQAAEEEKPILTGGAARAMG